MFSEIIPLKLAPPCCVLTIKLLGADGALLVAPTLKFQSVLLKSQSASICESVAKPTFIAFDDVVPTSVVIVVEYVLKSCVAFQLSVPFTVAQPLQVPFTYPRQFTAYPYQEEEEFPPHFNFKVNFILLFYYCRYHQFVLRRTHISYRGGYHK